MEANDETAITEIEIGADGRIYIFGASREILEMIRDIGFEDEHLRRRLEAMIQTEQHEKIDTPTHFRNSL